MLLGAQAAMGLAFVLAAGGAEAGSARTGRPGQAALRTETSLPHARIAVGGYRSLAPSLSLRVAPTGRALSAGLPAAVVPSQALSSRLSGRIPATALIGGRVLPSAGRGLDRLDGALAASRSDLASRSFLDAFFSGGRPQAPAVEAAPLSGRAGVWPVLRKTSRQPRSDSRFPGPFQGPRRAQAGGVTLPLLGSLAAAAAVSAVAAGFGAGWIVSGLAMVPVMLVLMGGYVGSMAWLDEKRLGGLAMALALPYLGGAGYLSIMAFGVLHPFLEGLVSLSDLALLGGMVMIPLTFALLGRQPWLSKLNEYAALGVVCAAFGIALGLAGAANAVLGLLPSTYLLAASGAAVASALPSVWAALLDPAAWAATMTPGVWRAAGAAGFLGFILGSVPWGKAGYGWRFDFPGALAWGFAAALTGAGALVLAAGPGGPVGWTLLALGLAKPWFQGLGWLLRRAFTWEPKQAVTTFPGKDQQAKLKAAGKAFDRARIDADGGRGWLERGLVHSYEGGRGPTEEQIAELRAGIERARPDLFHTLVLLVGGGEPKVVVVRSVFEKDALKVGKKGVTVPGVGFVAYTDWLAAAGYADRRQ